MKLIVLTTQTTHHAYFVRELQKSFPVAGVLLESETLKAPFETSHAFETKREGYERKAFFGGKSVLISDLAETHTVPSVNAASAVRWLKAMKPDVTIVFGTGKIKKETIEACRGIMLNLHGGDPQQYRGLDSHLWAIYHKHFNELVVTLHKLNAVLDDGEIVGRERIKVASGMKIYELRRRTTEICVRLVTKALREWKKTGRVESVRQERKGRYYSFMPACLKGICVDNFESHVRSLR